MKRSRRLLVRASGTAIVCGFLSSSLHGFFLPKLTLNSRDNYKTHDVIHGEKLETWIKKVGDGTSNAVAVTTICCPADKDDIIALNTSAHASCQNVTTPFQRRGTNHGLLQSMGGHACSCTHFRNDYVWSAQHRFDSRVTCELLNGRKVVFVGDSTMEQAAVTLMNLVSSAGCAHLMVWEHSDTLDGEKYGGMNRGKTLAQAIAPHNADIVVLSVGAHIYGEDRYQNVVHKALSLISMLQRMTSANTKFVWKTQQPGGCHFQPVAASTSQHNQSEDARWRSVHNKVMQIHYGNLSLRRYQYAHFYSRDVWTINEFRQRNHSILDLRMLYARPDAHVSSQTNSIVQNGFVDCLHYCVPGPLDVIGLQFQRLLENGLAKRRVAVQSDYLRVK